MKKRFTVFLISMIFIVGVVNFSVAEGFIYPTTDIAPNGEISFSLGDMHLGIGAGIGNSLEVGYALSFYNLGTYLKFKPFKNTSFGISYLPFSFCLFGTCEQSSLFNVYGVYQMGSNDLNINAGIKFVATNKTDRVEDLFFVFQKKINDAHFIAEGGVEKTSTDQGLKYNFAIGATERFGFVSFKGGLVWMNLKANADSLMSPLPYIEMNLILNLGR